MATGDVWGNRWAGSWAGSWGQAVAAVPLPTVNYQGDGKGTSRRKRRNRTHELFEEMERTIRAALAGPTPLVASIQTKPVIDVSRGFESALTQLATIAQEHEDLSYRLAGLRRAVEEYEAKQLKALVDDDEEIMLWLA